MTGVTGSRGLPPTEADPTAVRTNAAVRTDSGDPDAAGPATADPATVRADAVGPDAVRPADARAEPVRPAADAGPAVARRTALAVAGGAGLAAALTGCAGAADGGGPGGSGGSGGSGGADEGEGRGGGAPGREIAKVTEIPERGGKVVDGLVITQPTAGEYRAFSATCPHRGCSVRSVRDNMINCPCHDSDFDASDGSVLGGPASAPLRPTPITVEGDAIVLA
ncbi:Rieske (2Fe-2S) protein [Streptomyces sp. NPDC014894]|uniref:Rieske (2Fe-2S) protein n=1 Tax=Streptomyces sp. NPDC014894 TaxID=3364931 RepID=UPI0036FA6B15